jgi:hypothetical protein
MAAERINSALASVIRMKSPVFESRPETGFAQGLRNNRSSNNTLIPLLHTLMLFSLLFLGLPSGHFTKDPYPIFIMDRYYYGSGHALA